MKINFLSFIARYFMVSFVITTCLDDDNYIEYSPDATIHAVSYTHLDVYKRQHNNFIEHFCILLHYNRIEIFLGKDVYKRQVILLSDVSCLLRVVSRLYDQ